MCVQRKILPEGMKFIMDHNFASITNAMPSQPFSCSFFSFDFNNYIFLKHSSPVVGVDPGIEGEAGGLAVGGANYNCFWQ